MKKRLILSSILKTFLILFFLLLIFNFTALLFSYSSYPGLINHLFQAVSLITLTGYAPIDFYAVFSPFGKWLYWLLIQIDVLFYLYFLAVFFRSFSSLGNRGVRSQEFFNFEILKDVFLFLVLAEVIMCFAMFYVVSGTFQLSGLERKIHFCLMYVAGALGNVKVNLLSTPEIRYDPSNLLLFNLLVAFGVFVGSLGIPVLKDLIHPKVLRYRLKNPEVDWKPYTKIALFGTVILILFCAPAVYFSGQQDFLNGLPLMDQLFSSLILPLNARFGGLNPVSIDQFEGINYWVIILMIIAGGGLFATTGGLNISTFYFAFKKKYYKVFLIYILLVVLCQTISTYVLKLAFPDYSLKSLLSFQFNTFFNVGWYDIDFNSNGILLYAALIMVLGKLITFFMPWILLLTINPANLPKEISE